jgi:integrase
MKTKINKSVVNKVVAGTKDTFIWDTKVTGFGLKVTPAGKRVYILQYRLGRRKAPWRYTIGNHGDLTPDEARIEAERLRGLIAKRINPALDKTAHRQAMTIAELGDIFLEEHVKTRRKQRTIAEYERLFQKVIVPKIGRLPVPDITRTDIARLHHSLRSTPAQANRALAVLSKMFNWAELKGYRPDHSNPCRHIERNKEVPRERYLSPAELEALADALRQAETKQLASPQAIAAVRLLVFTGARLSEILTLKWDHVDFEDTCLRLPDSKSGTKVIHLNTPALEVLKSLSMIEGNPYAIVGQRHGKHLVNLEKPWRKLRSIAGLDDVRLHDLRHSFASFGAGAGMGLPMIGALLGHTQAATTQRYAHLATDPLKQATDLIGQRITDAMQRRKKRSSKVADFSNSTARE